MSSERNPDDPTHRSGIERLALLIVVTGLATTAGVVFVIWIIALFWPGCFGYLAP